MRTWLKRFGTSLDWPSSVSNRGKVSDPFMDYDGDGLQNLNDCQPKNFKKQDTTTFTPMGAAGQQQMAINQQKVAVPSQPKEEVVIAIVSPKARVPQRTRVIQRDAPVPAAILEPKPVVAKETAKEIPSRVLGSKTSPMLS